MGGGLGCHTWAWWLVAVAPLRHTRTHTHTHTQPISRLMTLTWRIFAPPSPLIPSEIIRRCCATWFIFPSPTRVHWPTVPPDVCPAATVALPSLSVCVCLSVGFLAQTYLFLAVQGIRKQGHRFSGVQRITASTHPCLHLSIHPSKLSLHHAIHLCPLWLLAATLITFRGPRKRGSRRGMVPLYLPRFSSREDWEWET